MKQRRRVDLHVRVRRHPAERAVPRVERGDRPQVRAVIQPVFRQCQQLVPHLVVVSAQRFNAATHATVPQQPGGLCVKAGHVELDLRIAAAQGDIHPSARGHRGAIEKPAAGVTVEIFRVQRPLQVSFPPQIQADQRVPRGEQHDLGDL